MGQDRATVKHAEDFSGGGRLELHAQGGGFCHRRRSGAAGSSARTHAAMGSTPDPGEQEPGDGGGIHFRCRGHPLMRLAG